MNRRNDYFIALRMAAGLTQQALADAAGCHLSQIQKIEYGAVDPLNMSCRSILSICRVLGITVDDFFDEKAPLK